MIQVRKSEERGFADHGWLKSHHTFSFADYHDPAHMGFRSLRVINEDKVAGGTGFGSHPHRDMEIITYVIKGALEHKDSMGNNAIIKPGEVQRMSAGSGVVHSEYNPNSAEVVHLFQIWIQPTERGGEPGYGQKDFESLLSKQKLVHVVSRDGVDGSISIKQDADIYISRLKDDEALEFPVRLGRGVWLQVLSGSVSVNGLGLVSGDAVSAEEESSLRIKASEPTEVLLFDLP